jgi:hypothetical protein
MSGLTRRAYRGSRRSHLEPSRDGSTRILRTDARLVSVVYLWVQAPIQRGIHIHRLDEMDPGQGMHQTTATKPQRRG